MSQSENSPQLNRRLIIQMISIVVLLIILALSAYRAFNRKNQLGENQAAFSTNLRTIQKIQLSGKVAGKNAEISGMSWFDEYLILLPQYPNRLDDDGNGNLFAILKSDLISYLDGNITTPLHPIAVPINSQIFKSLIKGYEGFEAITFHGDQAYLTIEASGPMRGYLVTGTMDKNLKSLELDTKLVEIPTQAKIDNFADEAMTIYKDKIYTFYEANGIYDNPQPLAHTYNLALDPLGTVTMPNIEYRLTDATSPDPDGSSWVVDYFYWGDLLKIHPGIDQFSPGKDRAGLSSPPIERLVELNFSEGGVMVGDHPPIRLSIAEDGSPRNWEALAILDDRGFLIATDKYPDTILAFIQR